MRCACVDIGSNTTRLLVAELGEAGLHEVLAERVFTRIRAGRGPDDAIPGRKIAELAEIVAHQVRLAEELGADAVRIVATAAIRGAPNRDELAGEVRRVAGRPVEVLAAEEEARLAFHGATRTLDRPPGGEVGVVDVGGGSSELVVGTAAGGATWTVSLGIGSGVLADACLRSDPPSAAEIAHLREVVAGAFDGVEAPRPPVAYAVGGSAASSTRLVGPVLSEDALERALGVLMSSPVDHVARSHQLHAERVRILPAGLLILERAAEAFGVPLRIGAGGLREGVVLEQLERFTERSRPRV